MLKHADIWAALDALARDHGLTASALARKAGLDPTTFNKSKRITRDGKPRWPSTESVAKVLDATGSTLADLVRHLAPDVQHATAGSVTLPLVGSDQMAHPDRFDAQGAPVNGDWDAILFPQMSDPTAFAIEIVGTSLEPLYREGDLLIVSPQAPIRRGDRIIVRTIAGNVMVRRLIRQTAKKIDLASLPDGRACASLSPDEVAWLARILWASQ